MESNVSREEILARLEEQEEKIEKIYTSVEKTRKMIFWSGVATLITFVIPFIILMFMLPRALSLFGGGVSLTSNNSISSHGDTLQQAERLSDLLNSLSQ